MEASRRQSLRSLVLVMVTVVIIGVVVAKSYYGKINRSVDPRILPARELYSQYNQYARTGDYYRIFALLDSIEKIYSVVDHYRASFETGVIENNRAAACLTIAMYADSISPVHNPYMELDADSIVQLARIHAMKAIQTYESWKRPYAGLPEAEIRELIKPDFENGLEDHDRAQIDRFVSNRIREIETALRENDRRLSVCHTNLGVIYRYQGAYEAAVAQYEKALALWDRNLDAENNLNKLLNRPIKKRNIIQKLFPPNRGTSETK